MVYVLVVKKWYVLVVKKWYVLVVKKWYVLVVKKWYVLVVKKQANKHKEKFVILQAIGIIYIYKK